MTAELKGIHAKTFQDLDVIKDVLKLDEEKMVELEKENAELKAVERMALYSKMSDQLTKAKEIIREFVDWATWQGNSKCPSFKSIQDKAEQFLSEVEK